MSWIMNYFHHFLWYVLTGQPPTVIIAAFVAVGGLLQVIIPTLHDDVIKWKHFPRYWPFVRGIHWFPVNSPHKRPMTQNFYVFFDLSE